jgi:hypothetical protein
MPSGVATNVAITATRSDSWIAIHSVGEMSNTPQVVGLIRNVKPYFSRMVFAADERRKAR